ncbi:hypothetical protein KDA11_03810 [Candidatus Saccharibacteria bacterium]|nr:hypothetical protein [Candidatus Saccharibacteria bacterium]
MDNIIDTRSEEVQMPLRHLFLCQSKGVFLTVLSKIPYIEEIRLGSLVAKAELDTCTDYYRANTLSEIANQYNDLCSTIRAETRVIGDLVLDRLVDKSYLTLGNNQYGKVDARYGHQPFCRVDEDVYTLFDWGADTKDMPHLRHATISDHVQLINDVISNE